MLEWIREGECHGRIDWLALMLLRALVATLIVAITGIAWPEAARAQAVTSYIVNNNGTIGAAQACTATPLVRNFVVTDSFVVADVDLGVFATHTWRGDMQITLISPQGTSVQLVNGNINTLSGNNFNVRLNDEGTLLVNTDGDTVAHSTTTPSPPITPFENDFIPNSALSAFDGEQSNGTWRMEICELFPNADDGLFRYAQLFLTAQATNTADLSLTAGVTDGNPDFGSSVDFTLSLTNSGPNTATNVEVLDQLPVGFDFGSASGPGTFNALTGIWSVPAILSGQTLSLTLSGTVSAPTGVTITNFAEITASDQLDLDSTPGNNSLNEDDDASVSLLVDGPRNPGVAPTLSCPVGTTRFDWDAPGIVWQEGVLSQSFTIAGFGSVGVAVSSTGTFVDSAAFGGQSPAESTANTGGLAGSQSSLHQFLDFADRQQVATTVITLPNAVAGAQFDIFDVDFAANDFADLVTVTGSYQGTTVIPVLTNGSANYVVGNTAIGDATSGNNSGDANITVTFSQPIDEITIVYGNAPTAPPVPDGQAVAIHDIDFCTPQTTLSVTKVSSVISDPVNGTDNPKAIPGAIVEYLISVSNTGISSTDSGSVIVRDDHPADIKLCRLDRVGGPVVFNDPGGDTGLSYSFGGLNISTDSIEFSENQGGNFGYTPVLDGDGCDEEISDFRIRPSGAMAGGSTFTLRARYMIID